VNPDESTPHGCATADADRAVFDRLIRTDPPPRPPKTLDTACVLGGSIAGLMAARVLADHARAVVIIERDDVQTGGSPRTGVPQAEQGHVLLPGGFAQIERWLPGFTSAAQERGALLVDFEQQAVYLSGEQRLPNRGMSILAGTRPFLESQIRTMVAALPNVSILPARATGLDFDDGAVRAVRYIRDGSEQVTAVDFVVDAMGRSSKTSEWVEDAGFQRPQLHRVRTDINYATALFTRTEDSDDFPMTALAQFDGPAAPDGLALGTALVAEGNQWMVMLTAYEPGRPPKTLEEFRATCAKLPPVFGHAAAGELTREIMTYRQADSRRRDFTVLEQYPARLVSVGDAVASFNPIYGQGMSSAALHASCLSDYLVNNPQPQRMATEFFEMQAVVTDAAWELSAGADAARLDALQGGEVSTELQQQRWAMNQVVQATLTDQTITDAFAAVSFLLAHPSILAEPDLLQRAVAANERTLARR
jgi:2-polyprenyl-6-methoxyphenol hydroxylase-like FAD-dependent oxidoreductase